MRLSPAAAVAEEESSCGCMGSAVWRFMGREQTTSGHGEKPADVGREMEAAEEGARRKVERAGRHGSGGGLVELPVICLCNIITKRLRHVSGARWN